MSEGDLNAGLDAFIKEKAAPLLTTVVDGHPIADLAVPSDGTMRYLIGAFIAEIAESEPAGFEYLSSVVKGALLASALYFPDTGSLTARLDNLVVYADTNLLLRAIGACGPELELYASEVVSLATKLCARVYCFRHSYDEMIGILDASEAAVRSGRHLHGGETIDYMTSAGWGPSDVVELKERLEDRLATIGVRLRDKPEHQRQFTLDETKLEAFLGEQLNYRNRSAIHKDVDSLAAIYRLRGGREFRHLEKSKAVFVTSNPRLARATRQFMNLAEGERDTVPLCVEDFVFTTLLWLKLPVERPDLPAQIIIADCYAAMRPSDNLWRQYVDKIDALAKMRTVTDDEYVLLRQSISMRSLIAFETKENPEAFTEGAVERVLAKARENIVGEARAETLEAKQELTFVQQQAELAREDARRQALLSASARQHHMQKLESVSRKIARFVTLTGVAVFGFVALAGTILATPWPGVRPMTASGVAQVSVFLLLTIFAGLTLYGIFVGGNLRAIATVVENALAPKIFRLTRKYFGNDVLNIIPEGGKHRASDQATLGDTDQDGPSNQMRVPRPRAALEQRTVELKIIQPKDDRASGSDRTSN